MAELLALQCCAGAAVLLLCCRGTSSAVVLQGHVVAALYTNLKGLGCSKVKVRVVPQVVQEHREQRPLGGGLLDVHEP